MSATMPPDDESARASNNHTDEETRPLRNTVDRQTLRSVSSRRNLPPRIPIRVNPIPRAARAVSRASVPTAAAPVPISRSSINNATDTSITAADTGTTLLKTTIELSNYPNHFTHHDLTNLFAGFDILSELGVSNNTSNSSFSAGSCRFSYPRRILVTLRSEAEAQRAVQMLDGKMVDGRSVKIAILESIDEKEKERKVNELASVVKIEILRKSCTSFSCWVFLCLCVLILLFLYTSRFFIPNSLNCF